MRSGQRRGPVGLKGKFSWGRMMGALAALVVLALVVGIGPVAAVSGQGSPLYPLRQALAARIGGIWQTPESQTGQMAAKTMAPLVERTPGVQQGGLEQPVPRAFVNAAATAKGTPARLSVALPEQVTRAMSQMQHQHRVLAGVTVGPGQEGEPQPLQLRDQDRDGSGDGQTASHQVGRPERGKPAGRLNPDRTVARGHELHASGQASRGGDQAPPGSADTGQAGADEPGKGGLGDVAGSDPGGGLAGSDHGGAEGGQQASGGERSTGGHGGSGGSSQRGSSGHGGR